MKREFRAHPLMIFDLLRPFLFVLLIPVLRGIVQYLSKGSISQILGAEMLLFIFIVLLAVVRWRAFRIRVYGKTFIIRSGIFLVKQADIPFEKITSAEIRQNPFDSIFGCVTYSINTEAGRKGRADYSFKLSFRDSATLSQQIYGNSKMNPVRFSPFKIAVLAATTSSAFAGIVVGIPILSNAAKLLDIGVNEIIGEISSISKEVLSYFPPVINTATAVLLGGYAIAVVYSFLRYLSFRLYISEKQIEIRSGFLVKFRTHFCKSAVKNLKIEQTIFMRVLNKYVMRVNLAGYGKLKKGGQILAPTENYDEIDGLFLACFPFMKPDRKRIGSKKGLVHKNRYLYWAELYFVVLMVLSVCSIQFFDNFSGFILFVTVVGSLFILYYAYLCVWEYKNCCIDFGKTVYAKGVKGIKSVRMYCPREKVGEIKLIRYPTDLAYKTCNVKIIMHAKTPETITIRHLDYELAKKEIFNCFGIKE